MLLLLLLLDVADALLVRDCAALPEFQKGCAEKNNTTLRKSCAIYLALLLKDRSVNTLLPYFETVSETVSGLLRDSDPQARRAARVCFASIKAYSPSHADAIYAKADSKLKALLDDATFSEEFDLTKMSGNSSLQLHTPQSKSASKTASRQQSRSTSPERERHGPSDTPTKSATAPVLQKPVTPTHVHAHTSSSKPTTPAIAGTNAPLVGAHKTQPAPGTTTPTTAATPPVTSRSRAAARFSPVNPSLPDASVETPLGTAAGSSATSGEGGATPTAAPAVASPSPTSVDMDVVIRKLQRYSVSVDSLKQLQASLKDMPQNSSSASAGTNSESAAPSFSSSTTAVGVSPSPSSSNLAAASPSAPSALDRFDYSKELVRLRRLIDQTQRALERENGIASF